MQKAAHRAVFLHFTSYTDTKITPVYLASPYMPITSTPDISIES